MRLGKVVLMCALGVEGLVSARNLLQQTIETEPAPLKAPRTYYQNLEHRDAPLKVPERPEAQHVNTTQAASAGVRLANTTEVTTQMTSGVKTKPQRVSARCRWAPTRDKQFAVYRIFIDPRGISVHNFCPNMKASLYDGLRNQAGESIKDYELFFRRCDLDSQDDMSGQYGWVVSLKVMIWPKKQEALNKFNRDAVANAVQDALERSKPGLVIDWLESIGCSAARGSPPMIDY